MLLIPQSDELTTRQLGRIFQRRVATYKFFWFISIMQIHAKRSNPRISVWDIVIRMVANAWYPIHYFRLSFGKSDSLFKIVMELQQLTQIPMDAKIERIVAGLKERLGDPAVRSKLRTLTLNVPYRFLRPWINTSDNHEMVVRSQSLENKCLYALKGDGDDFHIVLNEAWDDYLHNNYNLLIDFAYWNLTQFLQVRNPNVPGIPNKLIRPVMHSTLQRQHKYWDMVISLGGSLHCIYTGKELFPSGYDLDHFIPWSFVSHDLLWNLIPSDSSINSSKSNKIPDLDCYLPKLADVQHKSIQTVVRAGKELKVMEDYLTIGYTPKELSDMSDDRFREVFERTYNPISQIALNMGFETWKY